MKKQLAKRIAVTMLSATMAFSTGVPVMAAEVSVPASETSYNGSEYTNEASETAYHGTVTLTTNGDILSALTDAQKKSITDVIGDIDGANYWDSTNKKASLESDNTTLTLATALKGETFTLDLDADGKADEIEVTNVAMTGPNNWSFRLYDKTTGDHVDVTVNTEYTYTLNAQIEARLNYYFANLVRDTYAGKTVTTQKVAKDLEAAVNKDATDNANDRLLKELDGITFEGEDKIATDGKGTIKFTLKYGDLTDENGEKEGKTYTVAWPDSAQLTDAEVNKDTNASSHEFSYDFEFNVNAHSETEEQALQNAITAISSNTYPSYVADGDSDNDDADTNEKVGISELTKKITADLVAAGAPQTAASRFATTLATNKKVATATANGYVWTTLDSDGDVLKINLTYSSAQKIADMDASIKKAFVGGKATTGPEVTIEAPDSLQSIYTADSVKTTKYVYGKNTVLSSTLQKAGSTSWASIDDVVAAVKSAVDTQLAADKDAYDDVTVSVEAVDPSIEANKSVYTDSTKANKGDYAVLVTISTPNDFYGWDDEAAYAADKTTAKSYVVEVQTVDITPVDATAIDLKDQTVTLANQYSTTKYGAKKWTIVTLDATLTPEDANSEIVYGIVDDNGDVTALGKVSDDNIRVLYDADGNRVELADNQKAVSEPGVMNVIAIAMIDGQPSRTVRDTATIRILANDFADNVDSNRYYYSALHDAKANGYASGVGDNKFGVGQTVTRAQFVTWLYNYAKATNIADISIAEPKQVFDDVPTTAYYAAAVEWAKENGVVSGKTATTFAPNEPVKRQDIAVILFNYFGQNAGHGYDDEFTIKFTDVSASAYYAPAVRWAQNNNVIAGTTATTFSPAANATREQAYTMLYRAYTRSIQNG